MALTPWQLRHPLPLNGGTPTYLYVMRHFVGVVAESTHGKVLLTIWTSYFAWLAFSRRRKAGQRGKRGAGDKGKSARKAVDPLAKLVNMLRPALRGERRWVVAYLASLSVRVLITVKVADLSAKNVALMTSKGWDSMFRGQAWFGLWCMSAAGCTAAMKYLEKRMAMSVRRALYEKLLSRYLDADLNFYRLPLDDSASRLTTDLAQFSEELTHTFGFIVKPAIDVSYLTAVLTWRLGVKSMLTLYAFIVVSSKSLQRAQQLLPKSLKAAAIEKSELESSLRTAHDRVHNYREQIALQVGAQREHYALANLFSKVVRNEHEMLRSKAIMDLLNSYVLKYGGMMCGFSILIEPVYRGLGKYANATGFDITAGMMADINLLTSLSTAVGDLADSFVGVPRLRGLAQRVYELEQEMHALPARQSSARSEGDKIVIKNATIRPPVEGVKPLFTGLSVTVSTGQHTVVRGANGVGKTSLFRTLAGLWDAGVQSSILLPESLWVFPQDSYFPHGTLAEQIAYPHEAGALTSSVAARAEAAELLDVVGLGPWLREHSFDLDTEQDWHSVLSGGQKQRLAWVRMYHKRPHYALIDEGTSAVDRDSVDTLFIQAKKLGITLVTISHHDAVDAHHKRALDLEQGGLWSVTEEEEEGSLTPASRKDEGDESVALALVSQLQGALAKHDGVGEDKEVQRIFAGIRKCVAEIETA